MGYFDITAIAGEISHLRGVDDVHAEDADRPGLYYVDITWTGGYRILDEIEDIVVDYGGSIYDMIGIEGPILTLLVEDKPY